MSSPRVVIVGGGPGGLTCLLTLIRRGVPAVLYEREPDPYSRAHLGGVLDLGYESGQRALRENGLEEAFKAASRAEGDEYHIVDRHANVLFAVEGAAVKAPEDIRPEIDRSALRKLFLDVLPPESIKYGHQLVSVTPLGGGAHELKFANGVTVVSDVLIGADGAHSIVRTLLSSAKPIYVGVTGAEISLSPEVAAREDLADVRALVGNGSLAVVERGLMLFTQRNGDGRLRTYAWHVAPENWALPKDPAAARAVIRGLYEGWSPVLLKLIDHCDDRAIYHRPLYILPVGHRWDHVPGVTLIADAAHLITPFGGAGANLAMWDGLELGIQLAKTISEGSTADQREEVLAKWEEKMFAQTSKWAQISYDQVQTFIHEPGSVIERMRSFFEQPRNEAK